MHPRFTPAARRTLVTAVALAAFAVPVAAASAAPTVIDTTSSWDGINAEAAYGTGGGNTHTYGQIITAPAGVSTLTSFSFEVQLPTDIVSRGEVYAWNGYQATGDPLYESAPFQTTDGSVFQKASFTVPAAAMVPGQKYVLFMSTDRDVQTDTDDGGVFGIAGAEDENAPDGITDSYDGGRFVYFNDESADDWTTSTWENLGDDEDVPFARDRPTDQPGPDFAFTATFDDQVTVGPGTTSTDTTPTTPPAAPSVAAPAPKDTVAPVIPKLGATRKSITLTLNEAGTAQVRISRQVRRIVKDAADKRHVHVYYRHVVTLKTTVAQAGPTTLKIAKALPKGRYRITASAVDAAGNQAKHRQILRVL